MTTRIRRSILASHAFVPAGEGGLSQDSVILCEQMRVIDKKRIVKNPGRLAEHSMEEIARALRAILGL